MLDQDNNFYLVHLSILFTCLLDSAWMLLGEVTCKYLLGVKGLTKKFDVAVRLVGNRTQMTTFLTLNHSFFLIILLFFSKIVLVGVQEEGSRYASPAVSALKRLGARDPVLGSMWSSFAFAGYAGTGQPAWMKKQNIQQWNARYHGPSQITLEIPLSSSMSSQYSLLHV